MKPPRPRIVKPRLVWRLIGGNWTPFHRVTWTEGTKRKAREIKLDWKGDPRELEPGRPKPRDFKSCGG